MIGDYANPVHPEKSLEELEALVAKLRRSRTARPAPTMTEPRLLERKLTPDQVTELVDAYKAGTPTTELTAQYGLGKGSVLKLLEQHGVTMRRQPPTPKQIDKAARLYDEGESLTAIAAKLGISQTAIRNHLKKQGIQLRPRGGSKPRNPAA